MDNTLEKKKAPIRGDIYYADLSDPNQRGSEQSGNRPVIILQNNTGNIHSGTTIVAIITSGAKRPDIPTHVMIRRPDILTSYSTICLEQIKTIDQTRLVRYLGNAGPQTMREIDKAASVSLGIGPLKEQSVVQSSNAENITKFSHTLITQKQPTIYDETHPDWHNFAKEQLLFYQSAEQHCFNLQTEIIALETQIEDTLTDIEKSTCNAAEGYRYYKILRENRLNLQSKRAELSKLKILVDTIDFHSMRITYQEILEQFEKTN